MNSPRAGRIGILIAAFLALAMLSLPGGAAAKDRNRDRIPDRWEKQHKLSLKKNQRKLDQDRDGLRNRGEWLAGTNPRDRDSDDDGTIDGKEHAGFVAAYDAEAGTLTVTLYGGGEIAGSVSSRTEVECEGESRDHSDHGTGRPSRRSGSSASRSSMSRGEDESEDDDGSEHESEDDDGSEHESEDSESEDEDENGSGSCSLADLAPGVIVHEAEVRYRATGAVFTELEIEKSVPAG